MTGLVVMLFRTTEL